MKHVCIVTTRHISYNPRVLKEADALHNAGFKVTVVTTNYQLQPSRFDAEIMATRSWTLQTVNFRKEFRNEKIRWFRLSVKQKISQALAKVATRHGILERAMNKAYDPLLRLAIQTKADLYIVHHAEALGIGYQAARINKAKFAFDAEDFHTGMNKSPLSPPDEEVHIEFLERKYLPHCHYMTAASKGIGEAYAVKYGLKQPPTTVLNVFPTVDLPAPVVAGTPVKFYWFSQVIGPNRNLEYLLKGAAAIDLPFEVHFRGDFHSGEYRNTLEALIEELHLSEKVFFHPPILAEEIIPDASRFDIGFAVELKDFVNSNLCVSNKTFAYLMAGLAIIGNDTDGQQDIFSHFPEVTRLCTLNDVSSLTSAMLYFLENPERLATAKKAARMHAEKQFNWQEESKKLLRCVHTALA